jgi:3-hydroxymyristoyl/3-hydroxydecanoyl-(acyl carrier protein) dehydratase
VSAAVEQDWIAAAAGTGYATPVRAVDAWRCRPTDGGRAVTARLRVDPDGPAVRGHFPGYPVLPGVFLLEALCQAMALSAGTGPVPRLRAIEQVRFTAPLLGGDTLTLEAEVTDEPDGGWRVTAEARRGDGARAAWIRGRFETGPGTTPPGGDDHARVRDVLPQRYPMLLVDRVLAREPGRSVRTVKAVTATDPCYAALPDGTPPEGYAYPRSLLVESFGQSAALLWLDGDGPAVGGGKVLLFAGVRGYDFEGDAYPGDLLRHEVRLDSVVADTAFAGGETWVGDRRIATVAILMAARRPRPGPPAVDRPSTSGHR